MRSTCQTSDQWLWLMGCQPETHLQLPEGKVHGELPFESPSRKMTIQNKHVYIYIVYT